MDCALPGARPMRWCNLIFDAAPAANPQEAAVVLKKALHVSMARGNLSTAGMGRRYLAAGMCRVVDMPQGLLGLPVSLAPEVHAAACTV